MVVYFNDAFCDESDVRFSPNDRGLLFADGVYEVVRSYRGKLFRLDDHLTRLRRSLDALRIRFGELDRIGPVCLELVRRNNLEETESLFYVQITRGAYPRAHAFPPGSVQPTFYVCPEPFSPRVEEARRGVSIILASDTRWARCDVKSLALLANVLALQDAVERGAFEAVFVRDGMVIEGTRSNVAGMRDGVFITPPESNYMLSGVTRKVAIEMCKGLGMTVEERNIPEAELFHLDELVLMGTGSEILPVVSCNGRSIGSGEVGPLTRTLQKSLRDEATRIA